ncbi:HutD family protein [Pseudorhodobacter sp.]|uniref:HutD/Ves family protein n=1 Tax=Pseudorhodobacter sp. TaxID=1934400 RepID=UPI002648A8F7|nr:HutD family protein [Pseudorhodobacter sp.]MDN5785638.1 HutD family protein [Pseudorhodobacter sp.]
MTAPQTRHLTRADYTEMPWANGRGTTVEILRQDGAQGFLWRFSMASVAENGPFSQFPGIDRNLTVIAGPGFDLLGEVHLHAAPLHPVAFPGDVAISAKNVTAPSIDFNVMTRRPLPLPVVQVLSNTAIAPMEGAILCLFSLGDVRVGPHTLGRHDMLFDAPQAHLSGDAVVAIQLFTNR